MIIRITSPRVLLGTIAIAVNLGVAGAAGQIAITEFMNNPDGADQGREWIELYNFGPVDLCLAGWTIQDEDTDLFALPDVTIPSGGYLVLVSGGVPGLGGVDAATAEAIFAQEWLGVSKKSETLIDAAHGIQEPRTDGWLILKFPFDARDTAIENLPRGHCISLGLAGVRDLE